MCGQERYKHYDYEDRKSREMYMGIVWLPCVWLFTLVTTLSYIEDTGVGNTTT
jgi:hypothetical protein